MNTLHFDELANLADQLDQSFDKDPWYGDSILSILESVDPESVFDPPARGVHSIAEVVNHMITWREFAERRLNGDNDYLPDQEGSFSWQHRFPDRKQAWRLMRERLEASNRELISLLRHSEECLLNRDVYGKPYSFRYLLNGIVQHDLYHIGQISLIRKLLHKPRPEPGILRYSFRVFPYRYLSNQK